MSEDRVKIYTKEEITEQIKSFEDVKLELRGLTRQFHNAIMPYRKVYKESLISIGDNYPGALMNRIMQYFNSYAIQWVSKPPLKSSKFALYDTNPGARVFLAEFSNYDDLHVYAKRHFEFKESLYLIDVENSTGYLRLRTPLSPATDTPFKLLQ